MGPPAAEILRALSSAPVFGTLSARARGEIARRARVVVLAARQRLWRAGDEAQHVGIVLGGRLKILQPVAAREVIVDVALPGEIVGEVAFALGSTYQSTVASLRRARVILVPSQALRRALEAERGGLGSLAADLAAKIQQLMRLVQALSAGGVERRLARVLVDLAARAGEPFPGGIYIPIRLRRSELAALAATSKESVSRKIGGWSRRGWIVPQPIGYLLRDLPALERVAQAPSVSPPAR